MATGIVLSVGLNLHETINGRIVDVLSEGDRFEILGERSAARVGKWLRICWQGQYGWVVEFDGVTGTRLVHRGEVKESAHPHPKPKPSAHKEPVHKRHTPPPHQMDPSTHAALFWCGLVILAGVAVFVAWLNAWI